MRYPSINTVYKRDPDTQYKTLLHGVYSDPEFDYLSDCHWMFTEKIDGTNIRIIWTGESYEIRGRTDKAEIPPFLLESIDSETLGEALFQTFGDSLAVVYGEGYGAKIQKGGGLYRSDTGFIVFDVFVNGMWLRRIDVGEIAGRLDFPIVPLVDYGTLPDLVRLVEKGDLPSRVAEQERMMEGLVARPQVELQNRRGNRIIAKLKLKDFPRE